MNTLLTCSPGGPGAIEAPNRSLKVQVVATSFGGTRAALATARSLAAGLEARVTLFVPYVVPYGEVLEQPSLRPELVGARWGRLAEELSFGLDVRVCVCRSWTKSLPSVLSHDAPVVIGGKTRRFWPTGEDRLRSSLARGGYHVLFACQ